MGISSIIAEAAMLYEYASPLLTPYKSNKPYKGSSTKKGNSPKAIRARRKKNKNKKTHRK